MNKYAYRLRIWPFRFDSVLNTFSFAYDSFRIHFVSTTFGLDYVSFRLHFFLNTFLFYYIQCRLRFEHVSFDYFLFWFRFVSSTFQLNYLSHYLIACSAIIACSCCTESIKIWCSVYIARSVSESSLAMSWRVEVTDAQFWTLASFSRSSGMVVVNERTRAACSDRWACDWLMLYSVRWHFGTQSQYAVMLAARLALTVRYKI